MLPGFKIRKPEELQTLLKKGGSPETAWGERKEGRKLDEKVREGKKLAGKRETWNTLWRRQDLWGRGRDAKGEGWGGIRVSARSRAPWRLGSGRRQRPHPTLTMKGDSMKTSGVKLARKQLSQPAPRLAEPEPGSPTQARAFRRAPRVRGQQELFLPGWRETARRHLAAGTAWKHREGDASPTRAARLRWAGPAEARAAPFRLRPARGRWGGREEEGCRAAGGRQRAAPHKRSEAAAGPAPWAAGSLSGRRFGSSALSPSRCGSCGLGGLVGLGWFVVFFL